MSELENLARSAGQHKSEMLILDVSDQAGGGFDRLRQVQHYHSLFTLSSTATMFLMATRNFFLPPGCRVPPIDLSIAEPLTAHCTSTTGYFVTSFGLLWQLLSATFRGESADWSLLFFVYGDHNSFTLGPLYQVLLIGAFYMYISHKMRTIITAARANTPRDRENRRVGDALLKDVEQRGWWTLAAVAFCAIAIVFQSMVVFYLPVLLIALRAISRK